MSYRAVPLEGGGRVGNYSQVNNDGYASGNGSTSTSVSNSGTAVGAAYSDINDSGL